MRFRRWVVFTFMMHLLVITIDKGSGLALWLLLANEPDRKGAADLVNILPFIMMSVANLGLATSGVYYIRKRRFGLQEVAETSSFMAIVWGGLVAGIAILASQIVLPLLKPDWEYSLSYVVPICLTVPFMLTTSYFNSIQLAADRIRDYNLVHVAASVAFLPLFLVFYLGVGTQAVEGMALTRLSVAVVACGVVLWMLRGLVRWRPRLHRGFLREGLRFGWRANIVSVLTYLNHRLDLFLVGFLFVPVAIASQDGDPQLKEVAYYSWAVTFAELVWHFPEATRDLFFSKVAGSSPEEARVFTPTLSRLCLAVGLAGSLLVYGLVDPFMSAVSAVFGIDAWSTAGWAANVMPALAVLMPGTVCYTVAKILQNDLAARNHLNHCITASTIVLVTMVSLDVVLIPVHGAIGAAVASTAAYVVSSIYSLVAYRITGGAGWIECLFPRRSDLEYARDLVDAIRDKVLRPRT